jgi:transcriptional regulator with XRE-family HTH domain
MGVGLRLKTVLREKKMTIKELSEQTGISLNTLYSITKRDTENVDEVILGKISDALLLSWSFFSSCAPFEDLDYLQRNKETILFELEKAGRFARNGRNYSDIENYEYWKVISDNVFDFLENEDGSIQVLCDFLSDYDPISDLGADVDSLIKIFTKLEHWGRKLVIEYAELLASNPGFLIKEVKKESN